MFMWRNVAAGVLAMWATSAAMAQPDLVPIITYNQSHALIEQDNTFPMVRVYATGDVIVYRGAGYKNPGLYELKLSDDELDTIKNLAQQAGVAQFDETAIVEALSDTSGGMVFESSDPTTSIFEFNRVNGANSLSAGDGSTSDAMQTVVLEDISMTTTSISNSALLGPLSALHKRLIELFSVAGR